MPEFNEPPLPGEGDAELPADAPGEEITVTPVGKRKRVKERKKRSVARRITYWVVGVVALALIAYGGFYAYILYKVENNIRSSTAIKGLNPGASGKGMDLLIMGLDTRRDENGKPLSPWIYNALHAGLSDVGGDNSNVLMYIHVPDNGSKATAISIPRDDWVDIPGCATDPGLRYYVGSYCKGKIKSAYGWALAESLSKCGGMNAPGCWQKSKDAARLEEIKTVEQFLNVKITSFVEVTMVAFFQIVQEVGKVQVCVKENTTDSYSGANFHMGLQWVNAKNAVAFVRQRRDPNTSYNFTDLDRTRRQQAFIVSLLTQLKSAGTLLNPITLNNIVDVASNNVVVSDGLDPLSVGQLASNLSGGNLHFYTLPVVAFSQFAPSLGATPEDANEVNVPQIQAIVRSLLHPKKATIAKVTPLPSGAGYTVNAVNASGVNHAAAKELSALAKHSYHAGSATDGGGVSVTNSTVSYNPTDKAAAEVLAKRLGGTVTLVSNAKAKSHVLTLTIGTALANHASGTTAPTTVLPSIVPATGGGIQGPGANQLSDLTGGGIPCVK